MAEATKRMNESYPWKRWINGKTYQVLRGKHFQCSITGFRNTLYSKAKSLKQKVEVHETEDGKGIRFQFGKN